MTTVEAKSNEATIAKAKSNKVEFTKAEVQKRIDRCIEFIASCEKNITVEVAEINEQVTRHEMYRSIADKKIKQRRADYAAAIHQMRKEMADLLAVKTVD